jgi:hypothetical protein
MSLPHTNREMLLSTALDGELSIQEQVEFDRALASDPEFAREFEELQSLRLSLKASFKPLREQRPAPDFTTRIVAAAFEQAAQTTQIHSTVTHAQSPARRSWNRAATVCALAACLLIALGIWSRDRLSDLFTQPSPQSLAELDRETSLPSPDAPDRLPNAELNVPAPMASEMLAVDNPTIDNARVATTSDNERPKVMGIKPLPESQVANLEPSDSAKPTMASPESIASAQALANPPNTSNDKPAAQIDRQPLSVVLVLAVELTKAGHDQLAIQEALRATKIRLGEESIVGSQVVAHLQDNNVVQVEGDGKPARLFFIEASTKQIDRLVTHLMTSPESVASVGLSLAIDPPLLAAVGDLREIDPTKVRQEAPAGFARDIQTAGEKNMSFDSKAFAPLTPEMAVSELLQMQAPAELAPASGDDSPSQLLLFVK